MDLAVAMSLRAAWCPDQGPGAFKAKGGQRCSWCPHRCLLRCGLPVSRTSCCCWNLASFYMASSSSHRCLVGGWVPSLDALLCQCCSKAEGLERACRGRSSSLVSSSDVVGEMGEATWAQPGSRQELQLLREGRSQDKAGPLESSVRSQRWEIGEREPGTGAVGWLSRPPVPGKSPAPTWLEEQ